MIELMRRIGFPPFKRMRRVASPRLSTRMALFACSEPLEARMMLASSTLGDLLHTQSAYVAPAASFSLLAALSRGGDALMAHAGLTETPPTAPQPVTANPLGNVPEELMLRYVPGEANHDVGVGGVLAAGPETADGEDGDVSIQIGQGVFVIYNANTGSLRVDSSRNLSSVEIVSASGIFTGSPAANLGGPFDVDTDVKIFKLSPLTTGGSAIGFGSVNFGNVAQTNLTDSFIRNDLTITGSLVPSGGLSSKSVGVEVFATDLSGNRISTISIGTEFELRATVRDVRATDFQTNNNVGVFSAYFDVEWNATLAEAVGTPVFSSGFSNAKSGTVGPGSLDEVGALSSSTSPTDTKAQLLFRQRMRATSGGDLTFSLNPADVLPQHQTTVFGGTAAIPVELINFDDDATLEISDTPTAPDLAAFAKALADAGAKMYGAGWCPHCTEQKELFQDGQKFLPFVEVTNPDRTPNQIAIDNNITSYPTWVFSDGTRLVGQQSLETLATTAGITIPESNKPTIIPIDDVTLLTGSPLHVALDGYDPNGGPLTYTVTSDNPTLVTPQVLTGNRSMMIDVEGFGKMVFELFEDEAPRAVEQITSLAEDGFFDDLTFHRILNNFVIQGGDPKGDGTGDSDLPDFDDQFDVDLQHNRTGLLSMAKTSDDTNNSQFFITEGPSRHLDFNHTIFGQLTEGESNRDNISNVAASQSGVPTIPVKMESVTVFEDVENGLLRLSTQGSSGTANITVTVKDAEGHEFTETFQVTVEPDDEPQASNGGPFLEDIPALSTPANTPLTFQLTAVDVEGDPVKFSGSTSDQNISITVNETTGQVTVTPDAGFVGTATATVRVTSVEDSDTQDPFDSQLISIEVLPDTPTVDLLDVSDTGVSATDNITNATELQFLVTGVASGAEVTILADGEEIGSGTAASGTVTITTSNLSALGDDTYSITAIQTVDGQDSDESDPIELTLDQTNPVALTSTAPTTGISQTLIEYDAEHPEEGDAGFRYSLQGAPTGATIDTATGEFSWTPTSAQVGTNAFAIVVTDSAGNTQTQNVSIDITSMELLSVRLVVADAQGSPLTAVAAGQAFQLQVFVEDLRDDSDDLRGVFAAYVDVNYPASLVEVTGAINYSTNFPNAHFGTTTTAGLINDAGATAGTQPLGLGEFLLMTIPMMATDAGTANFTSDGADELPLLASLLNGKSEPLDEAEIVFGSTTVTIVDATFAVNDDFEVAEDTSNHQLDVLDNDIAVPSTSALTITAVGTAGHGTVAISNDGQRLVYTPTANFNGEDTFTYTIEDDAGDSSTATVTIDVTNVNDAPVAGDDNVTVAEDAANVTLNVLTNDSAAPDVGEVLTIASVTSAGHGTVTVAGDGKSLVYTPAANFSGADTFSYTLSDGHGGTDTAQVTVTVTEVNDAPSAERDIRGINEDTTLTLSLDDLLGNDSAGPGEDGQTLTVTAIGTPTAGSATLTSTGVTFTPPANFVGTVAIEYTVADNGTTNGQADPKTSTGTITINIFNVNDTPTAVDDTATAQSGAGSISINVLANDSSAPDTGETLTVTAVGEGSADGTITIGSNGQVQYTPAANFSGTETFTYTISDGNGGQATATVTVTVQNFVSGGIKGLVIVDSDGVPQATSHSLSGVKVMLTGTDSSGAAITRTASTNAQGEYSFADLPPGSYTVTQQQPTFTVNGLNKPMPGNNESVTVKDGNSYAVQLSADGLGETRLNFAERSLDPKFSIWDALASSSDEGLVSAVHSDNGQEWTHMGDGWNNVEVTNVRFNEAMSHVIITIRENGQTLRAVVPRSDHARLQIIGHNAQTSLVRINGARSDFSFQAVTT
jgi:cyclophilin family peptidyl-prolyl cis-trans isomerase